MGFCMYCGRKLAKGENCNCQNNMAGQQNLMGMSNGGNMQQTIASYGSCKKCGTPLKQNDKFCDVCGTPVENAEERKAVQQPNQQMSNQGMPAQQAYQQPNQQMSNQGMPAQQAYKQPNQQMSNQGMPAQQAYKQPNQQMSNQGMPAQQAYKQPNQQMSNQGMPAQQAYQQPRQQIQGQGVPVQQQKRGQEQNMPKKKKKKGKIIAILLVCVLIVAGIGAGAFYFIGGQNTCEKTVATFCESKFGGDLDKMLETFPEEVTTKLSSDSTFNAMKKSMETANQLGTALLGDNYKYSYDITSQENLSKEDIEEVIQKYKDADMELKHEISEAKEVNVEVKASLSGADMNIGTYKIKCLKMNGKWYVDYFSAQ